MLSRTADNAFWFLFGVAEARRAAGMRFTKWQAMAALDALHRESAAKWEAAKIADDIKANGT